MAGSAEGERLQARMRAVLADAAMAFRDVPGVEILDEGDLVRSWAPGRPAPWLHAIARLDVDPTAFAERVTALEQRSREAGLPTLWWVDDGARPIDAPQRLAEFFSTRNSDGMPINLSR